MNLTKKIFQALCVTLPINLGLHFVSPSAYVGGLLIDYLVPTIYLQDLLALALIISWIYFDFENFKSAFKSNYALVLILLLYTLLLSTLLSPRFEVSIYAWLRWLLYTLVSLYISKNFDWHKDVQFVVKTLCYWAVFLGFLALLQFMKQGAVFNNYLILGEQPYANTTPLIDKENVFGTTKVPAYGIFRHPNIFGGILSVWLVLFTYAYRRKLIDRFLFWSAFGLGLLALLLTISYFSWLTFLYGEVLLFAKDHLRMRKILIGLAGVIVVWSLFIHVVDFTEPFASNPSVYKRMELLHAGYRMSASSGYLFGEGLNASTITIEKFTYPTKFIRFVQPPHNIFVLLLGEAGLIALVLFVYIFWNVLQNAFSTNFLLFVLLAQILILGSFDHYFLTIHQPFLMLWLLFGMARSLSYSQE
jgi:hypothetical protein